MGRLLHLDIFILLVSASAVLAVPPWFMTTPDEVTYVNIGDSIILNCEAEGTPTPEIMWFRDDKPVKGSESVGIFNDGTELRINRIRDEDIGDYLCMARNTEGRVVHDAKVVIAGGAVIVSPPHNLTTLEGERAEFPCEANALPGNITVSWKKDQTPLEELSWLTSRTVVRKNGLLLINPTSADDRGFYTCEVSNGIGPVQKATAFLNVEYPARVMYTPTVQYLPFMQQGIIKCHIKSNPPIQFTTWIKERRLFDPEMEAGVFWFMNGSLLITKVNQDHQGKYSCTPYNRHGTAGPSSDMEVLVRELPEFNPRPQHQYASKIGEDVTLVCGGKGSPTPIVTWRRRDGQNLPSDRTTIVKGNLTINRLRKVDHGFYECEVKNEIMTIVTATQLLVEGPTPHTPYNIANFYRFRSWDISVTETNPFSIKLSWLSAGGSSYEEKYIIWYRTLGHNRWAQIDVKPEGSTMVTIHYLSPGTTYEFQVQRKNELGFELFSNIGTASTRVTMAADSPRLTLTPNKVMKSLDDSVYASCTADVANEELVLQMEWRGPGTREIPNMDGSRISTLEGIAGPNELDLFIKKLREDDVGNYTCTALYAGNQRMVATMSVGVVVQPSPAQPSPAQPSTAEYVFQNIYTFFLNLIDLI